MSEGSFWPKTWKEAIPLIVWGILIFAAGFEGIAALVHGEWLPCFVSFTIMLVLTAMLLHWKAWLEKVSPNWVAGGAVALIIAAALWPSARQGAWPIISWDSVGVGILGTLIVVAVIAAIASVVTIGSRKNMTAQALPSVRAAASNGQTHLDFIHLLDFAVNHTTFLWLTDLIMKAPLPMAMSPLEINGNTEAAQKSADFVRHVSIQLGTGYRRDMLLSLMMDAQAEAERTVEQMPQDQRPPDVDPLVVRRCTVANLQCIRAMGFLQSERRKIEQKLISQRSGLIERLVSRSGS